MMPSRCQRIIVSLALLLLWAQPTLAQSAGVKWSAVLIPADARAGESAQIVLSGEITPGWHLYSLTQPEGGSFRTTVELAPGGALSVNGQPVQPPPEKKYNEVFKIEDQLFEGKVAFGIPVKVAEGASGAQQAKVSVTYQICDERRCLPPKTEEVPVSFTVAGGPARPERLKPVTTVPEQPAGAPAAGTASSSTPATTVASGAKPEAGMGADLDTARRIKEAQRRGLNAYLALSFLAGLSALITPCVFPMIPITVSFFSKRQTHRGYSLTGPLAYCLGIISTFTALGVIVAALFGATGIQQFATNPYINIALAVLFVVLAANLFGVFEITLPSWLVNRARSGTGRGGFLGPMMMGLVFTLTSFTCTVPFVGTLLVTAAQGSLIYPMLGMLAFSTAFSLPFFLLALFPQGLSRMPKAGGWLVSVKVYMGFLELAAALKFLSNADLVWQLGWLTQPVFLAVWSTIFVIAGLYLLGWLRLPHDAPGERFGWPRRTLGVLTALWGIYCLAGIQGAPLGELGSFIPPNPYPGREGPANASIRWLHNYGEALAMAKAQNRALFLNFTGVTCTNCRWMEQNMFVRPDVVRGINNFIPVELYTDRSTPEDRRNKALQQRLAQEVSLPFYVVVSPDGVPIRSFPGLTRNEKEFVEFLTSAFAEASRVARR